ncbi:MAG: right-handed parallel beta-helix repeat-containing protein, partial [Pyrinomonadaceae bacterium]
LFEIGEFLDADGVRISGVRIDGGDMGIPGNGVTHDDDKTAPIGIRVNSSLNVEIANSEIYGWSGVAIQVQDSRHRYNSDKATTVRIHDNYIHHNRRYRYLGYGVATSPGAWALIERNVFDYNRHALESSGEPFTGYLAYENLLLSRGGENGEIPGLGTTHTHQFDVHGTRSCDFKDAYGGPAGEYFDYRYNTLEYTEGDGIKVRGYPRIGADVTQNVFRKGEGSGAVGQTQGDNLLAWDNKFSASTKWSPLDVCDFDGDGSSDRFATTGVTWWFYSGATAQLFYRNTSPKLINDLSFGDVNADGRCDVTVNETGAVFDGGSGKPVHNGHPVKAKRTDVVWEKQGTLGKVRLWQVSATGQQVADDVEVKLIHDSTYGGSVQPTGTGRLLAPVTSTVMAPLTCYGKTGLCPIDRSSRRRISMAHLPPISMAHLPPPVLTSSLREHRSVPLVRPQAFRSPWESSPRPRNWQASVTSTPTAEPTSSGANPTGSYCSGSPAPAATALL